MKVKKPTCWKVVKRKKYIIYIDNIYDKYSQRPPSQEFVTLFFLGEKVCFCQDPSPFLANVTKSAGFFHAFPYSPL